MHVLQLGGIKLIHSFKNFTGDEATTLHQCDQLPFNYPHVAFACRGLNPCVKTGGDIFWGSAPDPTGGAYSASPDPLAGFKGAYF